MTNFLSSESILHKKIALFTLLHEAQSAFILGTELPTALDKLLRGLLHLTESHCIFLGKVILNELSLPSCEIAHMVGNQNTSEQLLEQTVNHYLLEKIFLTKKPVLLNKVEPFKKNYLVLPLFLKNKLIGLLGFTHDTIEYDEEMIEDLHPVLTTVTTLIEGNQRKEQQRTKERKLLERERKLFQCLESRFHDMAATVPGVIYQWYHRKDGEEGFYYISPRCEEFFGVKVDELLRDWKAIPFHPDDVSGLLESINQSMENKKDFSFEGRLLSKTGEIKWWKSISKLVVSQDETIFNGIFIDITQRKKMEVALQEKEAILEDAQRMAHVGSWVLDFATRTLHRSAQDCRNFGIDHKNYVPTLEAFLEGVHWEDRERVRTKITDSFKKAEGGELEFQVIWPEGQKRYLLAKIELELGLSGIPLRLKGFTQDITERKQAQEALQHSKARLQKQNQALVELTKYRLAHQDDFNRMVKKITETVTTTLDVERGSVWLSKDFGLQCIDLYEKSLTRHSSGMELKACDYPIYFKALQRERNLVAHDAYRDPKTCEFSKSYLKSLNISSILDSPLRLDGQIKGVLSIEHVGLKRQWTLDEQNFGGSMADLICLTIEAEERRQTEEALRESEQKFRHIVEGLSQEHFFYSYNVNGQFTYLSPSITQVLGYTQEDFLKHRLEYLTDHPINQFANHYSELCLQGQPQPPYEIEIFHKDGSAHQLEIHEFPTYDMIGNIIAIEGVAHDITRRKQVEEELRKLSRAVEQSANSIVITDLQGKIEFVNPAFCQSSGYFFEEVVGKNSRLLSSGYQSSSFYEKLWKQIVIGEVWQGEFLNKKKNGELFWEFATISPVKNKKGMITHYVAVKEDITKRKQAEEELRKLSRAVEQSANAIVITDLEGRIEFVNPAFSQSTGYFPLEVLGKTPRILKSGHQTCEAYHELWERISRGEVWQGELLNKKKNGELFWEFVTISPVKDKQGRVTHYVAVREDITKRKRDEEVLRKYERIVSATPDLISLVDRDYIYQVVNDAYLKFFDKHYDEIVGHSVCELLGSKVFENLVKESLDRCLVGKTIHYQAWFEGKNHQRRFANVTYFPYLETDQTISGVVISIRDITEQRLAEEANFRQKEFLSNIIENIPIGIFAKDVKNNYCFSIWNSQMEKQCFIKREEIIGNTTFGHLDPMISSREIDERIMREGTLVDIFEQPIVTSQGTTFLSHVVKVPIYSPQGEPETLLGIIEDITKRKQDEQALRDSEERFKAVFNNAAVGIGLVNLEGLYIQVNAKWATMLGYSIEELTLRSNVEVTHPEDIEATKQKLHELIAGHQDFFQLEKRFVRKDGSIFWGDLWVAPLRDAIGKILAIIAIIIDITERKQAETQLQQAIEEAQIAKVDAEKANRAKSTFLANMSHELRTPLNGILGYTQILKRDSSLTETQKDGIHVIHRCGEHLLTLINDILDLSKIEANKLELIPNYFHFLTFLQDIIDLFKMRSQQKNISFSYELLSSAPTTVYADEKILRQILFNLLSNAVKFTHSGKVSFRVVYCNGRSRFEIEDTGKGIPADLLEAIFLPFQQIGLQNDQVEGTGLGLPISKRLVELMGGQLHVASLLGVGSLFWFEVSLPEVESQETYVDKKASAACIIGFKGTSEKQEFTILLADERWENRSFLVSMFKELGFRTLEADDGLEALNVAHECVPDVIITDLFMPTIDGIELTRRIRQSRLKDTIVIVNSASISEQYHQQSLQAGCHAFVPKPIDTHALLNILHDYLPLEWIYDRQETSPASPETLIAPPPEELSLLLESVMMGDLNGILNKVSELEQQDTNLVPFAKMVRELTNNVELDKLEELVKQYA